MKRLSKEDFIKKAKAIHNNKYDYSLVEYVNCSTPIKIILDGVIYNQKPVNHLLGYCPEKFVSKMNTENFIKLANLRFGQKYDYSLTNYQDRYKKVKIILDGVIYYQTPDDHLRGSCPENKILKKTTEEFIKESKKIHGDFTYDYSLVEYVDKKTKVKIIYEGEIYNILPRYHLKYGIIVNKSRGETIIKKLLSKENIKFHQQYSFFNCRGIKRLRFDFYLPDQNVCIEFDGIQHYESIEYFGGKSSFEEQKRKDEIKNDFCLNQKINLIRIPYFKMKEIEDILLSIPKD
jgi:very-short-patch-repair endonuclease